MDFITLRRYAEEFLSRKCHEFPKELDEVLKDMAKTGVVRLTWDLLGPILHYQLETVVNNFPEEEKDAETKEMSFQLLEQLDSFCNAPFTIQRLCELIIEPKKHYKRLDCYLRAVEKTLLVVSTQEPELDLTSKSDTVIPKGTHIHVPSDEPQSPKSAPEEPATEKDSPPTAPTSTWTNLHELVELEEGERKKGEEEMGEKEASLDRSSRESSPPLGGLLSGGRKRSSSVRSNMDLEEDELSITVRQEADSTVNFEPPLREPQGDSDDSPTKRARDCSSEDEKYGDMHTEEDKEEEEESRKESFLTSSSSHLVMSLLESQSTEPEAEGTGREEETERVLSEARQPEEELSSDSLKDSVVSDSSDSEQQLSLLGKVPGQVSTDCVEAMDTN